MTARAMALVSIHILPAAARLMLPFTAWSSFVAVDLESSATPSLSNFISSASCGSVLLKLCAGVQVQSSHGLEEDKCQETIEVTA